MLKKILLWVILPIACVGVYVLLSYKQPYFLIDSRLVDQPQQHAIRLSSDKTDHKGNTILDTLKNRADQLTFSYTLKEGHAYLYASVLFSAAIQPALNFSSYDYVLVQIRSTRGKLCQIGMLSKEKIKDTTEATLYVQELAISDTLQEVVVPLDKFYIPEWWFFNTNRKQSDYGRPRLDSVLMVYIGNSLNVKAGEEDTIDIHQLSFHFDWLLAGKKIAVFLVVYYTVMGLSVFIRRKRKETTLSFQAQQWSPEQFRSPEEATLFTYLTLHYVEDPSLAQVEKETGITEKNISRLVKEKTSLSFKQFLTQLRLTEAKRLLRESDLQVSEVVFKVGFGNVSHFNRVFKTAEGCSPVEYRKNNQTRL